jgi:arylsulfatase A-like enzyme
MFGCDGGTRACAARVVFLAVAGVATGTCGGATGPSPAATPVPTPSPDPPNLVLIVTDDLDVPTTLELPRIFDLMANRGMRFTRAYVPHPVCGPSRASILTGQFSHSHGVIDNHPPNGGWPAFQRHEGATIATWLHAAGYRTSLVGKYINDYPLDAPPEYIPPGWDDWYGHIETFENRRYFNYWVNDNGIVRRHGDAPEDYSADLETAHAVEFIRESAGLTQPLFLYLAPQAPHVPATHTLRHGGFFRYAAAPRVPSFNEADVRDKPSFVRQKSRFSEGQIDQLDKLQRFRLRSMLAVEDMVDAVIQALAETGRLGSSYIIFTSDNGLLMGQHRLIHRKRNTYEETIRVPLMVRGPGVLVGSSERPVLTIDLAPTLLELAGMQVPESVDGRSFVPLLRGAPPTDWRTEVLIENYGSGGGLSAALRTPDWLYAEIATSELELYDMRIDPYQVESLHNEVDPAFFEPFSERIRVLLACRGVSCRE